MPWPEQPTVQNPAAHTLQRFASRLAIEYFRIGYSPEHITEMLPGVVSEQVYAAITYYLHRRADMDAYLERQ